MFKSQIGVIGAGACDEKVSSIAEAVGREIAKRGALLVCGGLGGVMEAASCGAKEEGGTTLGILPGSSRDAANRYIDITLLTAMGHARNVLIVQSCDALIAVDGEYGTLSEIAHALKMGKPVVLLGSRWKIKGAHVAHDPAEAVEMAFGLI
jgi:hypothetical protein